MLENARKLAEHRDVWPVDIIHIDYGWFDYMGDWNVNEKFPHGMKWLADQIKGLGFKPGIWIRPGMVAREAKLVEEHPEMLVQGKDGSPLGGARAGEGYSINASHPSVKQWFEDFLRTVIDDWGYQYVKFEAMGNPAWRPLWETAREIAGDDVILQDNGALGVSLGYCDTQRTGKDPHHLWDIPGSSRKWFQGRLGIKEVALSHVMRYNENKALYWIDPDCITLFPPDDPRSAVQDIDQSASAEDKVKMEESNDVARSMQLYATVCGLGGGSTKFSGDFTKVSPEDDNLLSCIVPCYGKAAEVIDLLTAPGPRFLKLRVERPFGEWDVVAVLNWKDESENHELDAEMLGLDVSKQYHVFDFWNWRYMGRLEGKLKLPELHPHECLLLAVREVASGVQLLSSSVHVTQGGVELEDLRTGSDSLSGRIVRAGKHTSRLAIAVPDGKTVTATAGGRPCAVNRLDDGVIEVRVEYEDSADFRVQFE